MGVCCVAVESAQVAQLLASCDRRTGSGRRDFAILTVLARLGLRAGEVAALGVDDIDWRAGELVVTGKGNRRDRLPLPVDVGQAIADYCADVATVIVAVCSSTQGPLMSGSRGAR